MIGETGTLRELNAQAGDVVEMVGIMYGYDQPSGHLTIGNDGVASSPSGQKYSPAFDERYGRTYRVVSRAKPEAARAAAYEPKQHHIGHEISKSDLPPTRHERLMRKLEKQIAKASPKAHLTLAKLLKANEVTCSGSKLEVGPFRQTPDITYGGINREPSPYWDKGYGKLDLSGLGRLCKGKAESKGE